MKQGYLILTLNNTLKEAVLEKKKIVEAPK